MARDDFVIIRKDIALDKIFNLAFATGLISLLISRLYFVIFNFDKVYLNPLVFLLLPYYPGLSFVGGVLGGALFVIFYCLRKNYPLGRIFDFFSIAFLFCLPFGIVGQFLLTQKLTQGLLIQLAIYMLTTALVLIVFPKTYKFRIKDGTIGATLMIVIGSSLLFSSLLTDKSLEVFKNPEFITALVITLLSLGFVVRSEFLGRLKR